MCTSFSCGGFCLLMLVLAILPIAIASWRGHRNAGAITICALCGVLFLPCWVIALIWSCTDNVEPRH